MALQSAEIPLGVCGDCGGLQYIQPHDHRSIQTFTPDEASAYWEARKGVWNAPEPG